MALLVTTGKLLPKFIPSFAWYLKGADHAGPGRRKFYETARTAMARRGNLLDRRPTRRCGTPSMRPRRRRTRSGKRVNVCEVHAALRRRRLFSPFVP